MKDLFSFIAIMAVFVLAYGITTHGMYNFGSSNSGSIFLAKLCF